MTFRKLPVAVTGAALTLAMSSVAFASKGHKAHEHGTVKLGVAIDNTTVTISGEIPGDDAFGFEHDARNDKEKAKITGALATLRTKAGDLFQFPAEYGCSMTAADVKAPMEASTKPDYQPKTETKAAKGAKPKEEHQDVDADYTFTCAKSPNGATLRFGLFEAFPSIKTIEVQVTGATQSKQTAHAADDVIKL
jgi:hypothetical protein